MRKRVTALMLTAVMALSLFGCGAAAETPAESEATEESTEALAQEQEDSGETEAAD